MVLCCPWCPCSNHIHACDGSSGSSRAQGWAPTVRCLFCTTHFHYSSFLAMGYHGGSVVLAVLSRTVSGPPDCSTSTVHSGVVAMCFSSNGVSLILYWPQCGQDWVIRACCLPWMWWPYITGCVSGYKGPWLCCPSKGYHGGPTAQAVSRQVVATMGLGRLLLSQPLPFTGSFAALAALIPVTHCTYGPIHC